MRRASACGVAAVGYDGCLAAGHPCGEHGRCVAGAGGPRCYCEGGWEGEGCGKRYESPFSYALPMWAVLGSVAVLLVLIGVGLMCVYRSVLWLA